MRDLLVVTPSRGRPDRLAGMLAATIGLSQAQTDVAVCLDDDDAPAYEDLALTASPGRVWWHQGPRDTYGGWTNRLAVPAAADYRAVASLSDDHLPRTLGWDRLLLEAIDGMGGGFAYGDDLHQHQNLATSVVVSAGIVEALGWFTLPACAHYHVDEVWVVLGREAGCLAYRPDVVIEHAHPFWGSAVMDETYESEFWRGGPDHAAYQKWLGDGKDGDVATVRAACGR